MAASSRVFELRTYHAEPGKLSALMDRFRDHTLALFEKHGIPLIGFWTPVDADGVTSTDTLVYLLAFEDRAAANAAWSAFRDDPAWIKARDESEQHGKLVTAFESVYLAPTDLSPLV
jgi:hypothetical protein